MSNTNKAVAIVLAIIVVVGSFYIVISRNAPAENTNNTPATSTQNVTPPPPPVPVGVNYRNTEYGFNFSLPNSWEGYTVIEDVWEGNSVNASGAITSSTVNGPLVSIRHPDWDYKSPRQDIPVMVFTISQWSDIQSDKFHVGASPMNPTEIGRNKKYVFAIPARYNFSYLTGYEEVDELIRGSHLKPF